MAKLKVLWGEGGITGETLVWREGGDVEWKAITDSPLASLRFISDDPNALFEKANGFTGAGDFAKALEHYEGCLMHDGLDQSGPLQFNRAVTLGSLGRLAEVRGCGGREGGGNGVGGVAWMV